MIVIQSMKAKCVIFLSVERRSSRWHSCEIIPHTHQCCFNTAGNFKLSSLSSVDDVCVGGNASFKIDLTGDLYNLRYYWGQQHSYLPKNEHFEEKADGKILNIINALAIHAGVYTFYVKTKEWYMVQSISFELKVRGKIIATCKHNIVS